MQKYEGCLLHFFWENKGNREGRNQFLLLLIQQLLGYKQNQQYSTPSLLKYKTQNW